MLSFLIILSIIRNADSQVVNSCSSWSSSANRCTFYCDGSPYCVGQTINCPANWNCKVQCYYDDDRRRNLLASSCSGNDYGCCNSIINCPASRSCEIDCTEGCSGLTIYAQSSTTLLVKDCDNDNNGGTDNCQDMNIYCPRNGRLGNTDICEIEGGSSDDLVNVNVYTEEGLRDLKITNVNTDGLTLYCGKTASEYSCVLNSNGDACESGDTQCENFILPTPEPTTQPSQPTKSPTFEPTTSEPTKSPTKSPTSLPSIPPTKHPSITPTIDPTKNPTFTFNPTKSPTQSTSNPTITPTTYSPTLNPSQSPTPRPVRSGAHEEEDDDDDDGDHEQIDDANIIKGEPNNDEWIIYLVVILSIVIVIFFCCVVYAIIAKRRQREEEYGDEFRKVQSEQLFHTIPGMNSDFDNGEGNNLTVPKYKPPKKVTMTITGEHMEYNEVFGGSPLAEEEEEYSYVNDEEAMNRRLYYQAQFMKMMMEDEEQQSYLMRLDGNARKQYIEFQCNLYLQRVENMARRKTLPMKYDNHETGDAPTTDDDDSVDNIGNTHVTAGGIDIIINDDESIDDINSNNINGYDEGNGNGNGDDDDYAILNQINTPKVNDEFIVGNNDIITTGGNDNDDDEDSIDDINNDNDDKDILMGINTKGADLPDDMEADPLFD